MARLLKYALLALAARLVLRRAAAVAIQHRKRLEGRLVLVTGAAGGLGSEICRVCAGRGADLVLWDRPHSKEVEERLVRFSQELRESFPGVKVCFYLVDITNPQMVDMVAKQVALDCGTVYCLINNAGVMAGSSILDAKEEAIVKTFEVRTTLLIRELCWAGEYLRTLLDCQGISAGYDRSKCRACCDCRFDGWGTRITETRRLCCL